MKLLSLFTIALSLLSNSPVRANDCEAVLRLCLEQVHLSNTEELDKSTFEYFQSEGFRKDYRNGTIKAMIPIKGVPLELGWSDEKLHEWQNQLTSLKNSSERWRLHQVYFETRGLGVIAEAWSKCMDNENRNPIVSEVLESGTDASVTFRIRNGPAKARITQVIPVGVKQVKDDDGVKDGVLRPGVEFDLGGASSRFEKQYSGKSSWVIVQTNIGTGIAVFSPLVSPSDELANTRKLLAESQKLVESYQKTVPTLEEKIKKLEADLTASRNESQARAKVIADSGKVFREGNDLFMNVVGSKVYVGPQTAGKTTFGLGAPQENTNEFANRLQRWIPAGFTTHPDFP